MAYVINLKIFSEIPVMPVKLHIHRHHSYFRKDLQMLLMKGIYPPHCAPGQI